MFSKIVILAVVAISMAAVVQSADAPKKDATTTTTKAAPAKKDATSEPAPKAVVEEKKDGKMEADPVKRMQDCCPALGLTRKGAWKECNETAGVVCKKDCAFDKSGLLSSDKKSVDFDAVNKVLDSLTNFDKDAIAEAKTKCTTNPKKSQDKKCVGTNELHRCLIKSLAPKCPKMTEECKKTVADAAVQADQKESKIKGMQAKMAEKAKATLAKKTEKMSKKDKTTTTKA